MGFSQKSYGHICNKKLDEVIEFINNNTRKSIPLAYFKDKGHKINFNLNPRLDYLKIIDEFGGIYEKNS